MKHIQPLHYLTQDLPGRSHLELAEAACRAGVKWVQLRAKGRSFDEWKHAAAEVKGVCDKHSAVLIVNDNMEIASEIKAHGLHLGKKDMPIHKARNILGPDVIIGGTANTPEDVEDCLRQGADYVGIGPFRFTKTKKDLAPVLGLEGIRDLAGRFMEVPLIAIGGIRLGDVGGLSETGIHGIAVSSAINMADNPGETAWAFVKEVESFLQQ
ncbi:thiamine phosphate synthase [Fibrobacterota bacterium]